MDVSTLPPDDTAPAPATPVRRKRRLRYWVAAGVCALAVGALLFGGLAGNVVYYRTVPEALERRADGDTSRFRLAGNVVPGSVEELSDGVRFRVTDGSQEVTVVNTGDPPELFEDGAPVVCDGRWAGDEFHSDTILIRHGNEYTPPENGPYGNGATASTAAGS